ncbi:ci repressor-like protein [Mergibacter septicus]|uniref:DNA-binding protein n=1 Tax=Mergibacter septicus TaxID=221402 RepID=UPI0011797B0B|nr:DNA-binding protein [Mergibacter septicus]AWX13780.1 ci repressor-like protein [Mergibacter septicus]
MKNSQEWFSITELLEKKISSLPTSDKGITKRATRERWEKRQREGVKGKTFEYNVYTMPAEVQIALGYPQPITKELDKPAKPSQDDLQKRIDQLEHKLQALETKAQGFVSLKPPGGLTNDEWQLVCAFRRCNEDRQVGLLATAEALATQTEKEEKESMEIFKDHQVA